MMSNTKTSEERIDALDRAVFGHEGRGGLVRLASDNNLLITEHIKECRKAREEAELRDHEARKEQKRQFWGIITAVIGTIITIILTKLLG